MENVAQWFHLVLCRSYFPISQEMFHILVGVRGQKWKRHFNIMKAGYTNTITIYEIQKKAFAVCSIADVTNRQNFHSFVPVALSQSTSFLKETLPKALRTSKLTTFNDENCLDCQQILFSKQISRMWSIFNINLNINIDISINNKHDYQHCHYHLLEACDCCFSLLSKSLIRIGSH